MTRKNTDKRTGRIARLAREIDKLSARSGVILGKMTWLVLAWALVTYGSEKAGFAPSAQEQQLPHAMHSQMKELPSVTAGVSGAALVGNDNRVLQAAVDYIAGLG